ncbi:MAG: threonylcarbamoyl-AMP synthase, partial [Alphaproteobacteria bacterium]|nr:threonylcarbamoyl-AMP synthase [Alphaproteobacteria bacterium]
MTVRAVAGEVVAATPAAIARAARLIVAGELVAFPTETVYGLGADATNDAAIARLFAAKGRPRFNPLIVHVADTAAALQLVALDALSRRLADAFWPGPLTLVAPRVPGCPVSHLATAGLETVAVRVPAHRIAQGLIRATTRPIAAPSANRSGRVSATRAEHVAADFSAAVALILDGGPTPQGLESTVVAVAGGLPRILRPGALTEEAIAAVVGPVSLSDDAGETRPT